jgi:hypothetical protein
MKIEICTSCHGEGQVRISDGGRWNDWSIEPCKTCNGSGRLKTSVYHLAVPFDFDEGRLNKASETIINTIRSLHA